MDAVNMEMNENGEVGYTKEQTAEAEALVKELQALPEGRRKETKLLLIGYMNGLEAATVAQKA